MSGQTVILRKDAKAQGLKRYFTGKPCRRGHDAERFVSDGYCCACSGALSKQWKAANPEKTKEVQAAASAKYRAENPDKAVAATARWQAANKDRINKGRRARPAESKEKANARRRQRRADDPELRAKEAARHARWLEKNPGYTQAYIKANSARRNASTARWRAARLGATPKWLSDSDLQNIKAFYAEAQMLTDATGVEYHVDHIVPLQGENVCGLHVAWNLQVLVGTENCRKLNRLLPEHAELKVAA